VSIYAKSLSLYQGRIAALASPNPRWDETPVDGLRCNIKLTTYNNINQHGQCCNDPDDDHVGCSAPIPCFSPAVVFGYFVFYCVETQEENPKTAIFF
jgi:hypothetical protein